MKSLLIHLWVLPATLLVWIFYILPLWATRQIRYVGKVQCLNFPACAAFRLNNTKSWYTKAWKDWAGWAGPFVILSKDPITTLCWRDTRICNALTVTAKHEHRHCHQWMKYGFMFPFIYMTASVWIYLFKKPKHAYLDNPFERDARRYAGQLVDIPVERRINPNDRWPWW